MSSAAACRRGSEGHASVPYARPQWRVPWLLPSTLSALCPATGSTVGETAARSWIDARPQRLRMPLRLLPHLAVKSRRSWQTQASHGGTRSSAGAIVRIRVRLPRSARRRTGQQSLRGRKLGLALRGAPTVDPMVPPPELGDRSQCRFFLQLAAAAWSSTRAVPCSAVGTPRTSFF